MNSISELYEAEILLPDLSIKNTCLSFEQACCHADDLKLLRNKNDIDDILQWSRKKFIGINDPLDLYAEGWENSFASFFKLESALKKMPEFDWFELDSFEEQDCLILIPLHVTRRTEDSFYLDWADKWIYIAPTVVREKTALPRLKIKGKS